jgi:hypothetical protein
MILRKTCQDCSRKKKYERAGWYHDYYCDDGTELVFDRKKPYEHVCPKCGKVYTEARHNRAWVTAHRCYTRFKKLVAACGLAKEDKSLIKAIIPQFEVDWRELPQVPCKRGSSGREQDRDKSQTESSLKNAIIIWASDIQDSKRQVPGFL